MILKIPKIRVPRPVRLGTQENQLFTVKSKLTEPPDVLVLNWSLVADQVVPPVHERDLVSLEPMLIRTSDPSVRKAGQPK